VEGITHEEQPTGESPLGRSVCRRINNMRIDLRKIGWGGVDWIDLA
jgi:hypothetical protein